jgi:tetrahydromethanopterin S-methyltransferase subunit B
MQKKGLCVTVETKGRRVLLRMENATGQRASASGRLTRLSLVWSLDKIKDRVWQDLPEGVSKRLPAKTSIEVFEGRNRDGSAIVQVLRFSEAGQITGPLVYREREYASLGSMMFSWGVIGLIVGWIISGLLLLALGNKIDFDKRLWDAIQNCINWQAFYGIPLGLAGFAALMASIFSEYAPKKTRKMSSPDLRNDRLSARRLPTEDVQ